MSQKSRWAKLAGLPKQETKQQLDENVVGVGAVNQIFPVREPQAYETAFEHFLGEMYDSKAAERDDADHIDALEKDMEYDAIKDVQELAGLNKDLNEAMKFAEDLAPIIASELVEKGIVKQVSDVETILLDILEKVGKENNYTI
tara:strand:+ start:9653 stop:10084 length:432 start_codon:yes stop_codon:yes gene_type:complete